MRAKSRCWSACWRQAVWRWGGGFLGGLTADKYTKLAGTRKPMATRDLADLVDKGLLLVSGQGKGTRYAIAVPGWTQPAVE